MSSAGQTADLTQPPPASDSNPNEPIRRHRVWGIPTEQPLTAKIFYVSLILGILVPAGWLLFQSYYSQDWGLFSRSFNQLKSDLRGDIPLTEFIIRYYKYALYFLTLLPLLFVVFHGQTIELLHRTLNPNETNPRLYPEKDEHKPKLNAKPTEEVGLSTVAQPYFVFSVLYGAFRNFAWFKGLLSGPTLGAFLRIAILPLPALVDVKQSWRWFRSWALACPIISLVLVALLSAMWAADKGSFSQFNAPLVTCVVLVTALLLWPWVWIAVKIALRKATWHSAHVYTLEEEAIGSPFSPKHWYSRWTEACPWIALSIVSIITVAILDATGVMKFPKWPVWIVVFTIALWPWTWLVLRLIGRMFQIKRLYRRAQIYIEVHHLLADVATPFGLRNNYVLRAHAVETGRKIPSITCDSLFELYRANEDGQIQTYFETQEILPDPTFKGWRFFVWNWLLCFWDRPIPPAAREDERKTVENDLETTDLPQFLCPVKIKLGFICPTYLISGLLAEFDEDWKQIVRGYGLDMNYLYTQDPLKKWPELRKLQIFIWDCWIQWGPSVPVVQSNRWTDGKIGLQYGYGDENNSIPLTYAPLAKNTPIDDSTLETAPQPIAGTTHPSPAVMEATSNWISWKSKFQELQSEDSITGTNATPTKPFVIPAEVEGKLRWIAGPSVGEFCPAQQRAEAWLGLEAHEIAPKWDSPKLYSAYVWVIIAIRDRNKPNSDPDQLFFPFDRKAPGKGQAWKGLIPFFQHGNVAEPSVYESIKEELATKTIESLMTILERDHAKGGRQIDFSYVCAYDDNGDPDRAVRPYGDGSSEPLGGYADRTIRQIMVRSLERYAARDDALASELTAIKQRIHLEHNAIESISACDLPVIAERYLNFIEESLGKRLDVYALDYTDLRGTKEELAKVSLLEKMHSGLYAESFPDESERETYAQHYDRLFGDGKSCAPETHCLVAGNNHASAETSSVLGFLVFEWYPESKCALFSYLAVSKGFRDRGIAEQLIKRALDILKDINEGETPLAIFAETSKPGTPVGRDAQSKMHEADRFRVLHKLGAYRVPLKTYVQPALEPGKSPARNLTLLTFCPTPRERATDRPECEALSDNLIITFLNEFYRTLGVQDPLIDPDFQIMSREIAQAATVQSPGTEPIAIQDYGMPEVRIIP